MVLTVAGETSNVLLVPVAPELPPVPVAVIVKLPVFVMVTANEFKTPFTNAGLVIGAPVSAPVEVSITLLEPPLKAVTVLLAASLAVMVMGKATF